MKLYSPLTINYIKDKYGFKLSKSLGQNFLTDKNIIDKIIEGAGITNNDIVLEIGPGIGVITHEAAEDAAKVVSVELDDNLIPILQETLADCPNVKIVHNDILKTDVNALLDETRAEMKANDRELAEEIREEKPDAAEELLNKEYGVKIIGNLPYYITTPIIMKLLEEHVQADSITIMMQKEVADRIKAKPGNKDYGALSIAVQFYCNVEEVVKVPKTVFVPQPKVDSTVLRLDILKERPVDVKNPDLFFKVVKAGFGQRRKTLNNSLMGVDGITKDIVKAALEKARIDPIRRAETLNLQEFAELTDAIEELM